MHNFNQVFENLNAYTNLYVFVYKYFSKESTCQCRKHKRHGFDPWVGKLPWTREWQPTPVFLSGEFHGQRSLAGYSPWGGKESQLSHRHDWATNTFTSTKSVFKMQKKKVMYLIYCYNGYPIWCYPKGRMSVQDWSVFICLHSVSLQTLPSTSRYSGGEMWLGLYRNIPEQTCGGSNKLQTSNTHRTETFSEHKQRSVVPNCSYLVLLKNSETWI